MYSVSRHCLIFLDRPSLIWQIKRSYIHKFQESTCNWCNLYITYGSQENLEANWRCGFHWSYCIVDPLLFYFHSQAFLERNQKYVWRFIVSHSSIYVMILLNIGLNCKFMQRKLWNNVLFNILFCRFMQEGWFFFTKICINWWIIGN